jgi:transposase-like protein
MGRRRRKHSLEFKQEAVRLVLNEGMSYAAVGSDLDVNRTTIRVWCLKSEAGKVSGQTATPDQERPLEEQGSNCWDNAVAESFFVTLEQELVAAARWHDHHDARKAVSHYNHQGFNAERRHSTLVYLSPCDFESLRLSSCSEAA